MKKSLYIFLVLILFSNVSAQDDWLQGWRDATIAFGVLDTALVKHPITDKFIIKPNGDTLRVQYFKVIGTGVIFANPDTTDIAPYIVTAKHVFFNPKKDWKPDKLRIRFSWFSEKSVFDYHGIEINLKVNNKYIWTPHPNSYVDLAILPLKVSIKDAGKGSITPVRINNIATIDDAFEGASILLFGYPGAVGPDYWTKPIVRNGVIAHVNYKHFGDVPFLIDAMVFPGNSGGPVFTVPSGMKRFGNFGIGGNSKFLGIVSSVYRETVNVEPASTPYVITSKDSTTNHYKTFDFIGLSVIEPADKVKELFKALKIVK